MKYLKNNMLIQVVYNLPIKVVTLPPESVVEVEDSVAEEIKKRLSVFDVDILDEPPVSETKEAVAETLEPDSKDQAQAVSYENSPETAKQAQRANRRNKKETE